MYVAIGAPVPVGLDLEIKPDGKTEEHGFLVEVGMVPFPYGAPVDIGSGTTVAVLTMTLLDSAAVAEAADSPFPLPAGAVTALTLPARAVGVAVTVTVERATVTVTGTQEAAPAGRPETGEFPPAPEFPPAVAEETATTVTYFVEVEVPWIVVVKAGVEVEAGEVTAATFPDSTAAGMVA